MLQLLSRVEAMLKTTSTVFVIDDNQALRELLGRLLRSVGLDTRLFASISEFLNAKRPDNASVWCSM